MPGRWSLQRLGGRTPADAEDARAISSDTPATALARGGRWVVGEPTVGEADDGWASVTSDVDGTALRFEGRRLQLSTRPEALLTYFGPQALAAGADLVSPSPVDPRWRTGFSAAADRLAPWVDDADSRPEIIASPGDIGLVPGPPGNGRVGLCFTAGVDSFWALLRGGYDPTDLVYVWGYDVALDDPERFAGITASLESVAAEGGQRVALVRTDARAHVHNRHLLWGFHHGAALAAVAILLSEELDRFVIPPSYPDGALIPWGSRPDLDPLWSIPGVIDIVHAATAQSRYERIIDIAAEPLVHQHLRVCWEYLEPGPNCGRCEKCVRTMVMFAGAGTLEQLRTFPMASDLPAAILALSPLPPHCVAFWRALIDDRVPSRLRSAVERLVEDSSPPG